MDGLNTRFDIYANGFQSGKANDVADVNVRKGYTTAGNANWCNAQPSGTNWPIADSVAAAFPVDQNMIIAAANGSQTQVLDTTIAIGNDTSDSAAYSSLAPFAAPGRTIP